MQQLFDPPGGKEPPKLGPRAQTITAIAMAIAAIGILAIVATLRP